MSESVIVVNDWADPASIRKAETDWKVIDKYWIKIWPGDSAMVGSVFQNKHEEEIRNIVNERARLKKSFEDSMSLVYAFINSTKK